MNFAEILAFAGISAVVCVPDSLNSKLINELELTNNNILYIQALNEISAVAISSGMNLTGTRTLCIMENSGLRYAADIITRFELAQGIHNIYLLSNRGGLGEENWWGVFHDEITSDIISRNHMRTMKVIGKSNLLSALQNGIKTFCTEQVSVVLLLDYCFYEDLQ